MSAVASVSARLVDRRRPWRAPTPSTSAPMVAVIGAGPAGLAAAALLRRRGVRAVVLEQRDAVGGSWPDRYDSLRLNTVRWMSDLPGLRMPSAIGRWVRRDDLVAYLRDYAAHHSLEVRSGVDVERIARERDAWTIVTSSGAEGVAGVVVATGHSQEPVLPDWAGTDRFTGRLLHSAAYRRASDHAGSRVVVVGAGSSGGEICVDLATAGHDVVWSVRTAPRVFPREAMGVPTTPFAPIGDGLPDRWVDRVAPMIERWIHGARDYLPEPPAPMMQLLARCKEPMTADGIVDLIRDGRVRVVAAVDHLDGDVVLVDGSREPADDVIAATGYRPGLERLVGHLGVLRDGRPRAAEPLPGLHFVGYRVPLTGTLWAIETDARRAARRLGRQLGTG